MYLECPCCGLEIDADDVAIKTRDGRTPFDGYCRDCLPGLCPCEGDVSAAETPLGQGRRV